MDCIYQLTRLLAALAVGFVTLGLSAYTLVTVGGFLALVVLCTGVTIMVAVAPAPESVQAMRQRLEDMQS